MSKKVLSYCDPYSIKRGDVDICIYWNNKLERIKFNILKSISDSFMVQNNTKLREIELCRLDNVGGSVSLDLNKQNITIILCGEIPWRKFHISNRNDKMICDVMQKKRCHADNTISIVRVPTHNSITSTRNANRIISLLTSLQTSSYPKRFTLHNTLTSIFRNKKIVVKNKYSMLIYIVLSVIIVMLIIYIYYKARKQKKLKKKLKRLQTTPCIERDPLNETNIFRKKYEHVGMVQRVNNYGNLVWISEDVVKDVPVVQPVRKRAAPK